MALAALAAIRNYGVIRRCATRRRLFAGRIKPRSVRSLAKHLGVGTSVVHRVLWAEAIKPHRFRFWKSSTDPEFEPKMLAVVGLHMDPPENAVVLSVDEKTSIQVLDRTQLRQPMKPHRIERLSHECKRNGTALLLWSGLLHADSLYNPFASSDRCPIK